MKKRIDIILIAALLIIFIVLAKSLYPGLSGQYQSKDPASEQQGSAAKAPDFTVYDTEANPVKLSDMTGKPVIVNFWATWCTYCVQELPEIDRYAEEYKDQIDFMIIDLPDGRRETEAAAMEFAEKQGYTFPMYFDSDGSAAAAYGIQSIPLTLVIDKDGNLLKTHLGLMSEDALKQYIEMLTE